MFEAQDTVFSDVFPEGISPYIFLPYTCRKISITGSALFQTFLLDTVSDSRYPGIVL